MPRCRAQRSGSARPERVPEVEEDVLDVREVPVRAREVLACLAYCVSESLCQQAVGTVTSHGNSRRKGPSTGRRRDQLTQAET